MKKTILVLSVIAFIICACKEKPDKPTVVSGVDSLKNDSVAMESHENTPADGESEKSITLPFDFLDYCNWYEKYESGETDEHPYGLNISFDPLFGGDPKLIRRYLDTYNDSIITSYSILNTNNKPFEAYLLFYYGNTRVKIITVFNNQIAGRISIGSEEEDYEWKELTFVITKEFDVIVYKNEIKDNKVIKQNKIESYKIYDDGLIARENNSYTLADDESEKNHFVVKSDWEGVKCKKYDELDGYVTIQECTFPNASLQQVYNIVKRIDPNLKAELPLTTIECPSTEEGFIKVEYQYKSEKHLFINLFYDGGEIDVEIMENKDYTQSKITFYAD
jgi:hypothetical protein